MTDLHELVSARAIHPTEADATSIAVCAALVGISEGHLRNLIKDGKGPRVLHLGGRMLVTREDRKAWLREGAA